MEVILITRFLAHLPCDMLSLQTVCEVKTCVFQSRPPVDSIVRGEEADRGKYVANPHGCTRGGRCVPRPGWHGTAGLPHGKWDL